MLQEIIQATTETVYMVSTAGTLSIILGLPIGILLHVTKPEQILPKPKLNFCLSLIVNITRSIPFILLMVTVIPITKFIMHTSIGTDAALVPLTIGATPFFARILENTLASLDNGLTEIGKSVGASPWQHIYKIYLPEALPGILNCIVLTLISLVGFSAMAGAIGGGGLGNLAIKYGYQRYNTTMAIIAVAILVLIAQIIQLAGKKLYQKATNVEDSKKRRRFFLFLRVLLFLPVLGLVLSFSSKKESIYPTNCITVGVVTGPEIALLEVAQKIAKEKYDLEITIHEFADYVAPNNALIEGIIDANIYQHEPYLNNAIKKQKSLRQTTQTGNKDQAKIVSIGKTFIYPMSLYSSKHHKLHDIPENGTIGIPNDPSNEARALLLMANAKLITLDNKAKHAVTIYNIKDNPKKLQFKEIDAASLPRVLDDLDAAAVNTNYALTANLDNKANKLCTEDSNSPYANVIVVRTEEKDDDRYKKLIASLHTAEVLAKANQTFAEHAIPAWK